MAKADVRSVKRPGRPRLPRLSAREGTEEVAGEHSEVAAATGIVSFADYAKRRKAAK